jgi:ergothioneine biosynthesis protein EgtB
MSNNIRNYCLPISNTAYIPSEKVPESCSELPLHWLYFEGGLTTIGFNGAGFSFDNERPAHTVYIQPFQLASRLVTKGEFLEFIDSDAYNNPEYWLADGWAWRQQSQQQCPLYWLRQDERWFEYTLYGLQPLDRQQALIHVNYYEASAYANWSGVRLPTEFEWEYAVNKQLVTPDKNKGDLAQCFGCAWQWTSSSYSAYPGFRPFAGLAGEYNGKFMSNQYVLRGSSCVTSAGHARTSYRNFFYGHQSWQFTGIRLAQ